MPCRTGISIRGVLLQLIVVTAIGFTTSKTIIGQEKQTTDDTQPLIVDFGDGHTLEFVGITKNTAKAEEGWRPDGKPLKNPGYWKSTIVIHGENTISTYSENGKHPEPDPDAIDFLFRFRGLKNQPSIHYDLPTLNRGGSNEHVSDPYQIRICGRHPEVLPKHINYVVPDDVVRVGLSDEPWGRWIKILPDGSVPEPVKADELYATSYALIQIIEPRPARDRAPGIPTVFIRHPNFFRDPSDEWHWCVFEFRAVDTSGKGHWAGALETSVKGGIGSPAEATYGLMMPLPAGKTFSHNEYRVRPYKYWVTFDHISLKPGKFTEPGFTARVWP